MFVFNRHHKGPVTLRTPFLPAAWKAFWAEDGVITVMDGDKELYATVHDWDEDRSDSMNLMFATRLVRVWHNRMRECTKELFDSND
jgi:hypothetical protein